MLNPEPLYVRLKRHSTSRAALVIAFVWGVLEATLFFIVPDVYLGFVAVFHWRRGLLLTLVVTAGAMIGGIIMYLLAAADGAAMNQLLIQIPLIAPEIVRSVAQQMRESGLVALVRGPLQGYPYKIYAVQAGQQHLPLVLFLLMTVPARLQRILPVALAGAGFGVLFKRFVQRHTIPVLCIYGLIWAGVYLFYYLQFG
jgi:membrane protein YqaA with SNARE-associated domain